MSLYQELKRRNVIRVAMAYVVASWLIIQVAETTLPAFGFGDIALRYVIIILAVAFIPAMVFSWVFEFTPQGLRREADIVDEHSTTRFTGKKLDRIIMVLLAAALGYFAFDKFILDPARDAELIQETARQARSDALVNSYGDNSIAVLPFVNMSSDPEQDYFSDGISEELLNLLSKVPELRVISRTSAFSFKGKDIAIPAIAEQLNVAHVLEGSIRKHGDQVRVTAQLIEARSDSHLWSETYDRELTARNVFAIQSQIAESISDALDTVLAQEDRIRLNQMPTQNLQAYEAYLLGKQRMARRSHADLLEASGYFERAVNLDPQYALAHVGLADANLLLGNYGFLSIDQALAKAEPALSTAVSLDETLGAAYASMGLSRVLQGDTMGSQNAYKRGIALDPNYATSYHWYGDVLINSFGQPKTAIPLLEKARVLDPLSPTIIITLGEAYSGVGNIPEAVKFYRKAVEIQPDYLPAFFQMGMAYLALGDDSKAEFWIDRGMSLWPDEFFSNAGKATLLRYRAEKDQALQVARRLLAIAPGNNVSLVTLVNFGKHQEALETIAPDFPELSCEAEPVVTRNNVFQAMNLSLALQETGERACAGLLLERILEQLQEMPGRGYRSLGFLDAEIYARQGKTQQALDALREAIDEGLRLGWWSQVERSPHMVSMLENPVLKSMMAEVNTDLSAQLSRLREMEASGELAPISEY